MRGSRPLRPPVSDLRLATALMLGYGLVVAFIVFWPSADIASGSVHGLRAVLDRLRIPEVITPWHLEFVTNVLLFVPLSLLGATFRPRWRSVHWVGAGLLGTTVVEAGQWLFLPGRSTQLADLVANTSGALLGYLFVLLWSRWRPKSH